MNEDSQLDALARSEDLGNGRFEWEVPEGWQQGRGAFGGLVISAGIRAFDRIVANPDLTLRTVSATLCGPVEPGRATIHVRELRRGSRTLATACDIVQDEDVRAHLSAFYGARRVDDVDWSTRDIPKMPDWRGIDPVEIGPPLAPVFTQHIEFRPLAPFPFSGSTERRAAGWVRPKHAGDARDEAYLAALMDAFWPTFFATMESPRPAATVMFMMEFLGDMEGLEPDAPLFYRAVSEDARDGYVAEHRELWGDDGRILAINHQTFCVIK